VFLFTGVWLVVRTAWRRKAYNIDAIILASCLLTSMTVHLGTSLFVDLLDNEWGYWIVGLMLGYARAYGSLPPAQSNSSSPSTGSKARG
jgi:hypothetical protein